MHTFEVHFTWKSRQYVEQITTIGTTAAVAAVKGKYPGAYIGFVKQID